MRCASSPGSGSFCAVQVSLICCHSDAVRTRAESESVREAYGRWGYAEEDRAIEEGLVSLNDEPYAERDADGEEPDGVDDAAFIIVVKIHVVVCHGRETRARAH